MVALAVVAVKREEGLTPVVRVDAALGVCQYRF